MIAVSAFNFDPTKLPLTGGTLSGDLSITGELQITGQYVAPVRFSFESANDWRFTNAGIIQFSIGAAGQLNSAINRGHVYGAAVSDSASAIAHDLSQAFNLATPGAKLVSVKNAAVEKFSIDKDGDVMILGDLNHDGAAVGFYGNAPAAQSAGYTRNAAIVEDRTLLASASATTLNNNNVLAALIADIQATGLIG